MTQTPATTAAVTPIPTGVRAPHRAYGREHRSYETCWEFDESNGAMLVVMRSEGGYYCACFYPATFDRTPSGGIGGVISEPMRSYLRWSLETTPRYSAKRLREINEQVTAGLAEHLAATSPVHAEVLARASRAGALGAMNAAAAHLRATFPDVAARCATDAVAGWTCLSITYPSGNPRTHALHDDEANCWDVSCYPDVQNDPPYYEQAQVADADLADVVEAHHRRTF